MRWNFDIKCVSHIIQCFLSTAHNIDSVRLQINTCAHFELTLSTEKYLNSTEQSSEEKKRNVLVCKYCRPLTSCELDEVYRSWLFLSNKLQLIKYWFLKEIKPVVFLEYKICKCINHFKRCAINNWVLQYKDGSYFSYIYYDKDVVEFLWDVWSFIWYL